MALTGCGLEFNNAITAPCQLGTNWKTVDDFLYNGSTAALASAIGINLSDDLFVAGTTLGPDWVVRRSSDYGQTWQSVDTFDYGGNSAQAKAITTGMDGTLFVGGIGDNGFNWDGLVRKSSNNGNSWTTVETLTGGGDYDVFSIVRQNAANILLLTQNVFGNGEIARTTDLGSSWTNIQIGPTGNNSVPTEIKFDSQNRLILAGSELDAGIYYWRLWRGNQTAANVTVFDTYSFATGQNAKAMGFIESTSLEYFVVGYGNDSGAVSHWIVRKNNLVGSGWKVMDNFQYASSKSAQAQAIAMDRDGYLYVAGYAIDSNNRQHWIVRRSKDSGNSWSTIDDFQVSSSANSQAVKIERDSRNNLYVIGYGSDGTKNHWITRKLPCE